MGKTREYAESMDYDIDVSMSDEITTLLEVEKIHQNEVNEKLILLLKDEMKIMTEINVLLLELVTEIATNPRFSHFYEAVELLEDIDVIQSK